MNRHTYMDIPAFPIMDESPRTDRNLGWLFHMEGCRCYNEAVTAFPNYECVCHREAWFTGHLILGHLLGMSLSDG